MTKFDWETCTMKKSTGKVLERTQTALRNSGRTELVGLSASINSDIWTEADVDRFLVLSGSTTLWKNGIASIEHSFNKSDDTNEDWDSVLAAYKKVHGIKKGTKFLQQALGFGDVEDCEDAYKKAKKELSEAGDLQDILASNDDLSTLYCKVQGRCNAVSNNKVHLSNNYVLSQLISSPVGTQRRFARAVFPKSTGAGPLKKRKIACISTTDQPTSEQPTSIKVKTNSTNEQPTSKKVDTNSTNEQPTSKQVHTNSTNEQPTMEQPTSRQVDTNSKPKTISTNEQLNTNSKPKLIVLVKNPTSNAKTTIFIENDDASVCDAIYNSSDVLENRVRAWPREKLVDLRSGKLIVECSLKTTEDGIAKFFFTVDKMKDTTVKDVTEIIQGCGHTEPSCVFEIHAVEPPVCASFEDF